jgi:hypothetical protein
MFIFVPIIRIHMIYIQSNDERTLAHHFDCSCALYGEYLKLLRIRYHEIMGNTWGLI